MNIQKTILTTISMGVVFLSGLNTSQAALLELTHDPLFLSQSTPPAIAVTYDDSGSMQRAYVEGLSNISTSSVFADPAVNRLYYNPNITYRPPIDAEGNEYPNASMTAAEVDPFSNKITKKINLTVNYVPIREVDYERDGDVRINFARAGHPNLQNIKTQSWTNQYPSDDAIADQNLPGGDLNSGIPAFYYERDTSGNLVEVQVPSEQYTNFANWYQYNNTRMKLGRTSISRAFSTFGGSFKMAWHKFHENPVFPAMERFEEGHRKAFYDWLFDVPTEGGTPLRNAFVRTGALFSDIDSYRYLSGATSTTTHLSCQQNFHIAISDGAWNGGLNETGNAAVTFDESARTPFVPGDSTVKPNPNPEGLLGQEYPGGYTGGGDNQQIFSSDDDLKTLSDITFHYWANDLMPSLKNNVKRYGQDSTDIDGNLIEPAVGDDLWDSAEYVWNPKNDPAYWQHIVTYNIGFGLNASLVEDYIKTHINNETGATSACPEHPTITDPKEAVLVALRNGGCEWPGIPANRQFSEIVEKVDDVFHASINSRGDFFSATDPDELIAALNDVINNILERISKGGSSSFTSTVVTSDTKAFSPGFDSSNWTGNFFARNVLNSFGDFGPALWDTACFLTGGFCDTTGESVAKQTVRNLYTYDKTAESVISFSGSLSGDPAATVTLNSLEYRNKFNVSVEDVIGYVAGDETNEISEGGRLRNRDSLMADIVHSSPVVIRGPGESFRDSLWPDDSDIVVNDDLYKDFRVANQARTNLAFVGSNGGMLHAINISGRDEGKEKWGFLPNSSLKNIHRLIDPTYEHWSFVDNTPILSDAYFNNKWNSVLIGGMRYGGQAFYALDVTDTQASQPKVLWEFTDADDVDMGFSYGQATIMRASSTDEWVALIPNGYNNSEKDYPNSADPRNRIGDGSAVLYVVRLSDGQLLAKLDTNVGSVGTPNGMSSAIAVDSVRMPGGIDLGADYAYAGDVYGNLWRFDFRSSNYADWENSIDLVVSAGTNLSRPITQKPRVLTLPAESAIAQDDRDSVVMFGTGKYIELPDRSKDIPDQYVVGVYDGIFYDRSSANVLISNPNFVRQDINQSGNFRNISDNDVDLNDLSVLGWKIELIDDGERINTPLVLLGSQILLFASTVPTGEDPCNSGGSGWIVGLDPVSGSSPGTRELFETELQNSDPTNPLVELIRSDGVRVIDPPVGGINILEPQGGGSASIVIEGANETSIINLDKFSWRRRNFSRVEDE